jgi:hypothetical protein
MSTFSNVPLEVEALYVGYFERAADPAGWTFWTNQIITGTTNLTSAAASFSVQLEAAADYPFLGLDTVAAIPAFINQVYQNLFNRAPDAAGLAFWTAQLTANLGNPFAVGNFILNVISGAATGGADDLTLQNKVALASMITSNAQASGLVFNANTIAETKALVAATTSAAGSVATEFAAWTTYVTTLGLGPNTFQLTTGIDGFSASLPGAIFNAAPSVSAAGLANNTLNAGDSLTDTNGDGTLNDTTVAIIVGLNADPPFATNVTLSGIKTLNISATGFTLGGFQGNVTGLTVVNDNSSTGGVLLGFTGQGLNTLLTNVNITAYGGGNGTLAFSAFIAPAAASATATIALAVTGAMGSSSLAGADIIQLSNASGIVGTAANPNLTAGTLALTANSNVNLELSANGFVTALGSANVTGFTAITLAGAGNIALGTDAAGNFADLKSINASTATGAVIITGAGSGFGLGNALSTSGGGAAPAAGTGGNPGWLFGSAAGLLNGNTVFNSYTGTAASLNILDVSSENVAQFAAGKFVGNTATGIVNQLVVSDAVATTTSATTFANDTGWQQLDVTGIGGTINEANLPTTVNDIFYLTTSTAAVVVKNAVTGLTIDTEANAGGNALTVTSAAAAGASSTLSVVVGDATWAANGVLGTEALGALTITGESVVNISSVGGIAPVSANAIGFVSLTPVLTLNEVVNISGNTAVTIGTAGTGAIADFNPTSPTTLNFNNMTINDTDSAVVTLVGGLAFAVPGDTAGGSLGNPLNGSTNAEVINAATSGGLIMQAADINYTAALTTAGSVGDVITGSATGGNVLQGSIGNDVISVGNTGTADTISTGGGGDTITLAAGHTATNHIDFFSGFNSAVVPGGDADPRFSSITDANDVAQVGWWGLATGGVATGYAGATAATLTYAGIAVGGGTSGDMSTVANFVTGTAATPQDVLTFADGTVWNFGAAPEAAGGILAAGISLGLVAGNFVNLGAAALAGSLQLVAPGGTVLAGTNVIELSQGEYANAAAVATALHSGAYTITFAANEPIANSAHILVAYQNLSGNTVIMDLAVANASGAATAVSTALNEYGSDIVTLTGVGLTSLHNGNVHFVPNV